MQELITPTAHCVVTNDDDGSIVIADAEGHSARYLPNDKKEKHQLTDGTIETKTKWDKEQLRQEIAIAANIKVVRVYEVSPDAKQLIITTTMDGGAGRRRPPSRLVYDRDQDR